MQISSGLKPILLAIMVIRALTHACSTHNQVRLLSISCWAEHGKMQSSMQPELYAYTADVQPIRPVWVMHVLASRWLEVRKQRKRAVLKSGQRRCVHMPAGSAHGSQEEGFHGAGVT
jgi:hypothetical protein